MSLQHIANRRIYRVAVSTTWALLVLLLAGILSEAQGQQHLLATAISPVFPKAGAIPVDDELPWERLAANQKTALQPLEKEWPKIDQTRKKKWISLTEKFSNLSKDEQQRVQERMREWAKLTPAQRRVARENYFKAQSVSTEKKSMQWEQYQQLPDEQKRRLAEATATKKTVTRLPPPSQAPSSTILPIKATPRPVLEQSVTPKGANRSPLNPGRPTPKE